VWVCLSPLRTKYFRRRRDSEGFHRAQCDGRQPRDVIKKGVRPQWHAVLQGGQLAAHASRYSSIDVGTRIFDHFGPFDDFCFDVLREFIRRIGDRIESDSFQPRTRIWKVLDCRDITIELVDEDS
jgi:hypothetical protein